jgi:hypothetical protein
MEYGGIRNPNGTLELEPERVIFLLSALRLGQIQIRGLEFIDGVSQQTALITKLAESEKAHFDFLRGTFFTHAVPESSKMSEDVKTAFVGHLIFGMLITAMRSSAGVPTP